MRVAVEVGGLACLPHLLPLLPLQAALGVLHRSQVAPLLVLLDSAPNLLLQLRPGHLPILVLINILAIFGKGSCHVLHLTQLLLAVVFQKGVGLLEEVYIKLTAQVVKARIPRFGGTFALSGGSSGCDWPAGAHLCRGSLLHLLLRLGSLPRRGLRREGRGFRAVCGTLIHSTGAWRLLRGAPQRGQQGQLPRRLINNHPFFQNSGGT
mmetsp:Transcript_66239/g.158445  ORF Transcript_66239/g.158445 Transcript_66239/m.158445 type:complete len:208 (+) Transcript_66239:218-841(+)